MLATLSPRHFHQSQHRFAKKPLHRHPTSVIFADLELAGGGSSSRMKTRNNASKYSCKMDLLVKRRFPNHTEMAYREAVAKLKYLLAESYVPARASGCGLINKRAASKELPAEAEGDDEVLQRYSVMSATSELSKKEPDAGIVQVRGKLSVPPAELSSFIERQEEYIEQLEKESQYCREELKTLIDKVREVVAENEALQDKNKTQFFKEQQPRKDCSYLSCPSIVHESRISELEAQLTQARLELREAREDQSRRRQSGTAEEEQHKRELEGRFDECQRELANSQLRGKRAAELAQQVECRRLQAELELASLREELERRQDKLREALQETDRRIAEERQQLEKRYSQQVEQLSADVVSHWEAASKSHLEAEKHKRQIADLGRDLAQKQALVEELKRDLQQKTAKLQQELGAAIAEKDAAQQQLASLKLAAEANERQAQQEQSRLQSEISSSKMRLERADADLLHAKRENLRLIEEIAALEKEINMNKIVEETRVGVQPSSKLSDKTKEEKDKDKELAALIYDLESKHTSSAGGVTDQDDNELPNDSAALASSKKRRVKVDLKVKVVPKKKSAQSEPPSKVPIS